MSELQESSPEKTSLGGGLGFEAARWIWLIFTPILVAESIAALLLDASFLPGPLFEILALIWLFTSITLLGFGLQSGRIGI